MIATSKIPLWPTYQLLWLIVTPLLHIFYAWMAFKNRSSTLYLQRMGWQLPTRDVDIWLHAASFGEVNALLPLLRNLRAKHPQLSFMMSCNTPTGYALLQRKLDQEVGYCYMPLDKQDNMRRLLQHRQLRCFIVMETEIWPNLYRQLARQSVTLLLVNARISAKTLRAPLWILSLYRECLQFCSAILVRSQSDYQNLLALGAEVKRCKILGNIKYHIANLAQDKAPPRLIPERPYILIASTHDDEEYQICNTLLALENLPLLVVAPRHPHRAPQIVRELKPLDHQLAQRSQHQAIQDSTRLYLADTLGELEAFIHHAMFVIMGGSFVKLGGHNILEVAAAKKAVICGPYMHQFADETQLLLNADGLRQCDDYATLALLVEAWLAHPEQAVSVGDNAYQCMLAQQDILERYSDALQSFVVASS